MSLDDIYMPPIRIDSSRLVLVRPLGEDEPPRQPKSPAQVQADYRARNREVRNAAARARRARLKEAA